MSDNRLRMTVDLPAPLLDALLEALVPRVCERLADLDLTSHRSPWLAGAKAIGEYLGWPTQRVYKRARHLPVVRDGGRLMARRDELDRFIRESS